MSTTCSGYDRVVLQELVEIAAKSHQLESSMEKVFKVKLFKYSAFDA